MCIRDSNKVLRSVKLATKNLRGATTLDQIRGIEGSVAAAWWKYFATLVPEPWTFTHRRSHPSTDPVNALLSLGYMMLMVRAQTLLSVAKLDTHVGFLHAMRPGRPSLACDLIEPYRVSVVDKMVVAMLSRKQLSSKDFVVGRKRSCELTREALKSVIAAFENQFGDCNGEVHSSMTADIRRWCKAVSYTHLTLPTKA